MCMKIKKGDTVIIAIGKDKGRKGKVERVYPRANKITVSGINIFKRHLKKRDEKHPAGIIDIVKPIDVSKASLVCPKCSKPTRIGYIVTKGEKERICRKCEQRI